MKTTWHNFKTDPPYNYQTNSGFEDDPDSCWFYYRFKHKPHLTEKENCWLSFRACTFIDGVFTGYESHMKTSPYPEDHIEILYWCSDEDIKNAIEKNFNKKNKCLNLM